jgi:hypothetical protein
VIGCRHNDSCVSDSDGLEGQTSWAGWVPVVTPPRPTWFDRLVRLTVDGAGGEDRVRGVVRARIEDDGGTEFSYQVARRGKLFRCTSLKGEVHIIAGRETVWSRGENSPDGYAEPRAGHVAPPDDYGFGTARPNDERWVGDDFTVVTGPPRQVEFLGRDAWEVELAPPKHKPFPMQVTIDAQTGLLLREANAAFGTFHEWIELDTDADVPDELFSWNAADRFAVRYG